MNTVESVCICSKPIQNLSLKKKKKKNKNERNGAATQVYFYDNRGM